MSEKNDGIDVKYGPILLVGLVSSALFPISLRSYLSSAVARLAGGCHQRVLSGIRPGTGVRSVLKEAEMTESHLVASLERCYRLLCTSQPAILLENLPHSPSNLFVTLQLCTHTTRENAYFWCWRLAYQASIQSPESRNCMSWKPEKRGSRSNAL